MALGSVDACISSPPFGEALTGGGLAAARVGGDYPVTTTPSGNLYQRAEHGENEGQLANEPPDTFWAAARTILEQTFQLLKPGGHAIWVTKAYVRDKKLVDFPGDWRRLCESVGFETLHEHHAMLVEEHGTQGGLFGEETAIVTAKKSFFRRIAENHGSPEINWETVYCMVKPEP